MAGLTATVNLEEFSAALARMGRTAAEIDYGPALNAVSVYLAARAKNSFDMGVSPDGAPWLPLKRPRSRRRDKRAKGGTGQKPLRDTGLLMASVQGRAGVRGSVKVMGRLSVEQGTSLPYAGYHQFGTRHIPARPFLGVTEKDADRIGMMVADVALKQISQSGLRRA